MAALFVQYFALLPHSKKVAGLKPMCQPRSFLCSSHISPWVLKFPQQKHMCVFSGTNAPALSLDLGAGLLELLVPGCCRTVARPVFRLTRMVQILWKMKQDKTCLDPSGLGGEMHPSCNLFTFLIHSESINILSESSLIRNVSVIVVQKQRRHFPDYCCITVSTVSISMKLPGELFTASNKMHREWRRQRSNTMREKKPVAGKIFQIYCWPTDTIPYLMGL